MRRLILSPLRAPLAGSGLVNSFKRSNIRFIKDTNNKKKINDVISLIRLNAAQRTPERETKEWKKKLWQFFFSYTPSIASLSSWNDRNRFTGFPGVADEARVNGKLKYVLIRLRQSYANWDVDMGRNYPYVWWDAKHATVGWPGAEVIERRIISKRYTYTYSEYDELICIISARFYTV